MRLAILAATAAIVITGCSTVAKYSLQNDLARIGFSENMAECMADQLQDRLDGGDLQELAWHVSRLSRASGSSSALSALKQINNPRVIAAATASGLSCALAPNS